MVRERTAYVGELYVGGGSELLREGTAEKGGNSKRWIFLCIYLGGKEEANTW